MVTAALKNIGMASCSFILCLSLSSVTQADEYKKFDPCAEISGSQSKPEKCGEQAPHRGIHTITGEILHINGANLLVKQLDGKEVILHIDLSTQVGVHVAPGSRIEAQVNEVEREKYVISISQAR